MDQSRAVYRILAVIPGVVMPAGNIDRTLVDEWIKARSDASQLRRRLHVKFCIFSAHARQKALCFRELRLHRWNFRRRNMADVVRMPCVGRYVIGAAALVVQTERKRPRKMRSDTAINSKRERFTEPSHCQSVLAR